MKRVKFVGLDVHAETIAVAVAEQGGEVEVARGHSESRRIDSEAGAEAGTRGAAAVLL